MNRRKIQKAKIMALSFVLAGSCLAMNGCKGNVDPSVSESPVVGEEYYLMIPSEMKSELESLSREPKYGENPELPENIVYAVYRYRERCEGEALTEKMSLSAIMEVSEKYPSMDKRFREIRQFAISDKSAKKDIGEMKDFLQINDIDIYMMYCDMLNGQIENGEKALAASPSDFAWACSSYGNVNEEEWKRKIEFLAGNDESIPSEKFAGKMGMDSAAARMLFAYYMAGDKNYVPEDMLLPDLVKCVNGLLKEKAFSNVLDSESRADINSLAQFTDKSLIQKQMSASEISELFGIDESGAKALIFAYTFSLKGTMTPYEFANYLLDDVLTSSLADRIRLEPESVEKLKLVRQVMKDTLDSKKYSYRDTAKLLNQNEMLLKVIYAYSSKDLQDKSIRVRELFSVLTGSQEEWKSLMSNDIAEQVNEIGRIVEFSAEDSVHPFTDYIELLEIREDDIEGMELVCLRAMARNELFSPEELMNYEFDDELNGAGMLKCWKDIDTYYTNGTELDTNEAYKLLSPFAFTEDDIESLYLYATPVLTGTDDYGRMNIKEFFRYYNELRETEHLNFIIKEETDVDQMLVTIGEDYK